MHINFIQICELVKIIVKCLWLCRCRDSSYNKWVLGQRLNLRWLRYHLV